MPDFNTYNSSQDDLDNPASRAAVVAPHDTNPLPNATRGLYVGGAGDITCRLMNDTADVVFKAVPVGSLLPFRITFVRNTGTAATFLVAVY